MADKMPAREILSGLRNNCKNKPFPEQVATLMTYEAAIHLVTGQRPQALWAFNSDDDVELGKLEMCAEQLRKLGIEEYAKRAYGGEAPEDVDLRALKYDYFLYQKMDLLGIQNTDPVRYWGVKGELRDRLERLEEKGLVSSQDLVLHKLPEQEEARKKPLKEENCPVYEYEASDDVWRDYIAAAFYKSGIGARPVTPATVAEVKTFPFDKLTLRNKRTVERLQRGELEGVGKARRETERSFTYLRKEDLKVSQDAARRLSRQLQEVDPSIGNTREWRDLKKHVMAFQLAEDRDAAALASAQVLLAVEKFTKGKKNANQKPEVARGVNLALQALGTVIPNAPENPSVQPLVDRFNQVRRSRLQYSSMVTLQNNKALSGTATDAEILDYWKARMDTFISSQLTRPALRNGIGVVDNEGQALEAMAIAVALREAKEGQLIIEKDMESRIEDLKKDPILVELAHGAATERSRAAMLAANADGFDRYIKQSYAETLLENRTRKEQRTMDELQKQREEIEILRAQQKKLEEDYRAQQKEREYERRHRQRLEEEKNASRELKEKSLREDLADRSEQLAADLKEMKSDFSEIGGFDPEKAKTLFAELIAIGEVQAREKLGEEPRKEWEDRVVALKNDPAVEKMADELPINADFRRILRRDMPMKDMAEAMRKTYVNGGELPREYLGKTVSEHYAALRPNVQRLAGVVSGKKEYTKDQAALLLANLIAVREMELKGGKDTVIIDADFAKRVGELKKDPIIRNLGEDLLVPEHRETLAKAVSAVDEPEKQSAQEIQKNYLQAVQKDPAPEQPKQEQKQEQPQVIKEEGGPVIMP